MVQTINTPEQIRDAEHLAQAFSSAAGDSRKTLQLLAEALKIGAQLASQSAATKESA